MFSTEVMDARKKIILALAISESKKLLDNVMRFGVAEEDEEKIIDEVRRTMASFRLKLRGKRRKPTRIIGYVETTVLQMTSNQFREHFRMMPRIFHDLENTLGPILSKHENLGRSIIPIRKQILCTLWLLATPDSYRSVGDRFDMGKASASDSFMRVVRSLCSISARIIRWPREQEIPEVKAKFFSISRMPDVVGAIDGSDIEIKAPKEEPQAYINRKKRYTVILQGICNTELKFLDCFAGYPGSVGDLRVLRNSPIFRRVREEEGRMFPGNAYIIGDKIYHPVLSWLIPSFKDHGAMTQAQKNFNVVHAKTRQVIERAFSLLKGRFRRLKYLDMNRCDMISYVVLACCVLHNICLEGLEGVNDNIEEYIREGNPYVNLRRNPPEQCVDDAPQEAAGEAKRNYLVTIVPRVLRE